MSAYDNWRSTDERAEYEAALDRAVETRAAEMWEDAELRVDMLERIGMADRETLLIALRNGDYRRFARLVNDASYEDAESDLSRQLETEAYNDAANKAAARFATTF